MPRRAEEYRGDWGDRDEVDDDLRLSDEETDTVPCPYCRRPIHEDAERCPYCEQYISAEDVPGQKPWWMIAGALVCLLIVVGWLLSG